MSIHSRKCEFQADKYAADMGKGEMLISALLKLGKVRFFSIFIF